MNITELLALAEEHYILTFLLVSSIGLLQGSMVARGIRNRFPSVRAHTRIASIVLLIVFSLNALFSIVQFATIEKIDFDSANQIDSFENVASFTASVFGIDGGFLSIVAVSVTLVLTLLFRFTELAKIVRYFVLIISVIMLLVAFVGRIGGYTPTEFHVAMYALYHVGLVSGVYLVMRRRKPTTDDY